MDIVVSGLETVNDIVGNRDRASSLRESYNLQIQDQCVNDQIHNYPSVLLVDNDSVYKQASPGRHLPKRRARAPCDAVFGGSATKYNPRISPPSAESSNSSRNGS